MQERRICPWLGSSGSAIFSSLLSSQKSAGLFTKSSRMIMSSFPALSKSGVQLHMTTMQNGTTPCVWEHWMAKESSSASLPRLTRLCRIWCSSATWTKHSPFITGRGGLPVMSIVLALLPPRAGLSLPTCLPYVASRILPALPHLGVESTAGRGVVPFGGQHAPLVGELG